MNKAIFSTLALALIAMAPAKAAEDPHAILERLYTKLLHVMQGGADVPAGQIVIMASPGIPMPDDLDPKGNDDDQHALNQLFDTIPMVYPRFFDSGETFTSVYTRVMKDKVIDLPNLSDAQKEAKAKRIKELRDFLDNSPEAAAEQAAADAYNAEFDKLALARTEHNAAPTDPTKKVPSGLEARVGRLKTKWDTAYVPIGNAQNELSQILNEDPGSSWAALVDRANAKRDAQGTLRVEFFPAYNTWAKDTSKGWTTFTFSAKESVETGASGSMSAELEASYKKGSTSIAVGGSYSEATNEALSHSTDVNLKVDLKRVNVYHPAMDMSIFKNDKWYWNANSAGKVISSGESIQKQLRNNLAGKTPNQLMPIVTTGIWLARNVEITGSFADALKQSAERDIKAHLDVSVGPINVGGKFAKHDARHLNRTRDGKEGICAPDPQIIGFVAVAVGKSPTGAPKGITQ